MAATHPRLGEGARRAGQGGAQGRCERPSLPGVDEDGERTVLLTQVLPLALHGDVTAEPAGQSRLVRLPLPGQSSQGQMEPDSKVGAPYPDGRHDLLQLSVGAASPVI